ncbi:MAG: peptide ABC transporter substrate-binding protein [Verrucomicrobia bacterium]|nr:peptide ABC transporter substrate-binding protein [Verrucomicrobiota bacterium]
MRNRAPASNPRGRAAWSGEGRDFAANRGRPLSLCGLEEPRRLGGIWVLPLLFLLGLTPGCGGRGPAPDLVIINGKEPESLDPAVMSGEAEGRIVQALFEGLTRYNPTNGMAEPGLAESWTLSENGRRYRFRLRSEARWSNGEPIRTKDVLYSWFRMIDPVEGSQYSSPFYLIRNAEAYQTGTVKSRAEVGMKASDELNLEVELENPAPYFVELCAYAPMAVVPQQSIERHRSAWLTQGQPPASGAYTLVEWRLNDRVRLRKNPHYWDAAGVKSTLIDLLPVTHPTTALNLYLSGQADVIWDKDLIPSDLVETLRKRPDFHSFDYLATYFLRFNTTRKPFHDPRVRRALALAIDKRRIVEQITRGGERPAGHLVPPGLPGYVSPPGLSVDPDRARALLAEAGFPGGAGFPKFHYHFDSRKSQENIAVQIQAMWEKELGLRAELRPQEWQVYLNTQSQLDYDISRSSWIGDYNDPTTFLDLFAGGNLNNRTGWKHEKYDTLLKRAGAEPAGPARAELLRQAETLLVEQEMPVVPLYFYAGMQIHDPRRIEGIHPNLRAEHPLRAVARRGARR